MPGWRSNALTDSDQRGKQRWPQQSHAGSGGADVVYVYNSSLFPTPGYQIATTLGIGQGGIAWSSKGGALTLTPSP